MFKRTLLLIPMVLCPFGLAWGGDWPQWMGPERTGVSKETGLLPSWPPGGPKLLWIFRDAGAGHSCMAIVGNRLYSMGADDTKEYVFALDLNTQKKLWSTEVGPRHKSFYGHGPMGTPTLDGNFLYAIGGYGNLVCVDTASGRKVWSQELKAMLKKNLGDEPPFFGYSEPPLVEGDQVVATPGGKRGAVAAFDKKTGTLKWRSTALADQAGNSSMLVIELGGVRQYVQRTKGGVAGVRASDGKLLWRSVGGGYVSTPIYHNHCVYVCNEGGSCLIKIRLDGDQFKAEKIYHGVNEMRSEHGGAIRVGEYLYGYCEVDKVGWVCQEFKTGKTVWKKNPVRATERGSITFADGNLYGYHESKGDVLLIKATPEGCQEQGKFRIPEHSKLPRHGGRIWTFPVVANGKLYLRDQELIFCYDVRKPQ